MMSDATLTPIVILSSLCIAMAIGVILMAMFDMGW
jgi:hypothetical protein